MSGSIQTSNNVYYSVVDGEFRVKSNPENPNAVPRVNKNGATVYEVAYRAVFGTIEKIGVFDGQLGKQIVITLDPDENGRNPVLSFAVDSKEGRTIMECLPSLEVGKEVRFMPYKFVPEGQTEKKSGITLHTKGEDGKFTEKVESFFYKDGKPVNGLPTIDWDKATDAQKKIHGIEKTEFLLKYFTENVLPKFSSGKPEKTEKTTTPAYEYPEAEIDPQDVPF